MWSLGTALLAAVLSHGGTWPPVTGFHPSHVCHAKVLVRHKQAGSWELLQPLAAKIRATRLWARWESWVSCGTRVGNPASSIGGAKAQNSPLCRACHPSAHRQPGAVGGDSRWLTAGFCSLHGETTCSTGARVCLRCSKSPPLWGLALGSDEQPLLCSGEFSFAGASELLCNEPPWAGHPSNICERRSVPHQPPNTCTGLRQDKGLYLTHLSSGQMSKKSLLSFLWLNHQYTKTPSFSQECWKSCR